ncbi:MAG: hypothetical protein ACK5MR_16560 [Cumulibacter sp.]
MSFRVLRAAAVLAAVGALTACSADDGDAPDATSVTSPTAEVAPTESAIEASPTETEAEPEPEETLSDIELGVATYTDAFDALGIEYTDPVRAEVGGSGAEANFDVTVNGYDAGILVFGDEAVLEAWQEASDSFGGIHVASGLYVLSLNSSDGIADSAEIAPLIADEVGGEARGV